jgi:glycosyltransferase involved in cell wall biosynthesis
LAIDGSRLSLQRTGIENYFHHLLPHMTRMWAEGADPARSVIVFGRHPEVVAHIDDPPRVLSGGGPGWTQVRLPLALRRARAAVYFSPIPILPVLVPMPCPAVVTVHDLHEFRPRWGYFRRLIHRTLSRSAGVVCVSDSTLAELLEEFPWVQARCRVVREAADDTIFYPRGDRSDPAGQAILARLEISRAPLLAVGTLQPRKNYDRLVRAYARLGGDAPPLVIVGGKGWDYEAVLKLPGELGIADRVRFAGHLPEGDLGSLMRASHALCAVSTGEGFGLPLVEAMFCGLPILASDIPPFREVAGNAALFVDPLNVDEIAAGMRRTLDDRDLLRRLSETGVGRRLLFSWTAAAGTIVELLRAAALTNV